GVGELRLLGDDRGAGPSLDVDFGKIGASRHRRAQEPFERADREQRRGGADRPPWSALRTSAPLSLTRHDSPTAVNERSRLTAPMELSNAPAGGWANLPSADPPGPQHDHH